MWHSHNIKERTTRATGSNVVESIEATTLIEATTHPRDTDMSVSLACQCLWGEPGVSLVCAGGLCRQVCAKDTDMSMSLASS